MLTELCPLMAIAITKAIANRSPTLLRLTALPKAIPKLIHTAVFPTYLEYLASAVLAVVITTSNHIPLPLLHQCLGINSQNSLSLECPISTNSPAFFPEVNQPDRSVSCPTTLAIETSRRLESPIRPLHQVKRTHCMLTKPLTNNNRALRDPNDKK